MARYRKNKSGGLPEAVFGLIVMMTAITMLNPKLREQLVSAVQIFIAILFLCALGGLIYFLYKQFYSSKEPEFQPSFNRPSTRLSKLSSQPYSDDWDAQPSRPTFGISPVEAIREPVFREAELPSLEPLEWNESILHMIEWKRFEVVCKEYYRLIGYDPRETNIGADGGVDIRIYKAGPDAPPTPEAIVQCKAWHSYKVGVKSVRELFGIMAAEQVPTGVFITSGDFTSEAQEFAQGKKLLLVSGNLFIQKIRKLPEENQKKLLDIAFEGDYMTPTCPQCDTKMVLREGKKGKNPGSLFWGCPRYPRCRQTLTFKESV